MDLPTGLFIFGGLGLMLTPLDFVSNMLDGSKNSSGGIANYYSLIIPLAGLILLGIGLLAYHKKNIQYMFLRMCQDVEQTGFGRGLGNTLAEAFSPILSTAPPTGANPELIAISSLA